VAKRRSLGKRVRFEIFKRDGFTCQYCGGTPPGSTLHIDHIKPVSDGGDNNPDNLVTACVDCNLGKGAVSLDSVPQSLRERSELVAEREEQLRGYQKILDARRARLEEETLRVVEIYEAAIDGYTLVESTRRDVARFIDRLGVHEVMEAMEIACDKFSDQSESQARQHTFKYFCGVCWKKIRDRGGV
jgi:hypothetical protein